MATAALRVDSLVDSLRQRILAGELKPGTPLREEALSSECDGRLPASVYRALDRLVSLCRRRRPWGEVAEAHEALHHEIVLAAESARLADVHRQAGAELRLFVLQLPPTWTLKRIADDHIELLRGLESEGADALRPHIEESTRALLESPPPGA